MADQDPDREKNLKDYWQVLVRRRWVVFSFFTICATVVTLGTFLMTPLYRSETKLLIEGENTNVRSEEEAASAGSNAEVFANYIDTQIAIIKSNAIAGKVFTEFKLDETPRYRKKAGLNRIFNKLFRNDLYIQQIKGSRLISIAVENPRPKLASDLANRLADLYAKDNLTRRALTFIRNQRMAALNGEFLTLQAKLDNLSNRFGPKHPQMIALRNEIRTMAQRIESERYSDSTEIDTKIIPAEDQVLLEDALLKIQEGSVFSSSRMNNIGIVDKAFPARTPVKPKKILNIVLGAFAGILGGILLAFLVDYLDDTIKTDEDLKRYMGKVTFLGSIFSEKNSNNNEHVIERLVALYSDSPSVEAYRLIRMNVMWYATRENSLRDFAVVSPGPGEGKTTVASNLAIALAQANMKVLFVDTDFRRGRVHETYGLSNEKGLGEYLTDGVPLEEVVKKTDVSNLSVVTCGKSVIDSAQLLSSSRMTQFIQETRKKFNMIIYDTPPITIISDAATLISQIDGTILSIRCGFTNARIFNRALTLVRESKTKLIGTVLNGVVMNDSASYSKYYKKYYTKVNVRRG